MWRKKQPVWIQYQKCTQTVSNIFKYYTSTFFSLSFLWFVFGQESKRWASAPWGRRSEWRLAKATSRPLCPPFFLAEGAGTPFLPVTEAGLFLAAAALALPLALDLPLVLQSLKSLSASSKLLSLSEDRSPSLKSSSSDAGVTTGTEMCTTACRTQYVNHCM